MAFEPSCTLRLAFERQPALSWSIWLDSRIRTILENSFPVIIAVAPLSSLESPMRIGLRLIFQVCTLATTGQDTLTLHTKGVHLGPLRSSIFKPKKGLKTTKIPKRDNKNKRPQKGVNTKSSVPKGVKVWLAEKRLRNKRERKKHGNCAKESCWMSWHTSLLSMTVGDNMLDIYPGQI